MCTMFTTKWKDKRHIKYEKAQRHLTFQLCSNVNHKISHNEVLNGKLFIIKPIQEHQ